jgi:hypothetical protein
MIAFRTAFRLAFTLLALASIPGVAAAAPAPSESIRMRYDITLIGLPIGTAMITGFVQPNSYRVELNTKLVGVASLLSSSHAAATATGGFAGGHLAPASYATTSANAEASRTIRMAMKSGTVDGVDISPPFDASIPRVPVTAGDRRNILDPLSAFIMAVPAGTDLVGPGACNRTLPVFDGATRFDLELTFTGTRPVQTKGYSGDVAVCSVRYRPISGHRSDGRATQFMADNKDIEVWLAPVQGTRIVFPYRISVQTLLGMTIIQASEFSADTAARAMLR